MSKIKNFLFQNKKRKTITICSFVLAIVILLSAILVPVVFNINKKFNTEEEMFSYIEGIYSINDFEYFYIFEDNQLIKIDSNCCSNYIYQYLLNTKDFEATKKLQLSDCDMSIKKECGVVIQTECLYEKGKIIVYPAEYENGITINIKTNRLVAENSEINITKETDKTSFDEYDRFIADFENTKKGNFDARFFLPTKSQLKEMLLENKNTKKLINTNYAFETINETNSYATNCNSVLFVLGESTSEANAIISAEDDKEGNVTKITLTNDSGIWLDDLLDIMAVYLQDWPLYPHELHLYNEPQNEIIDKMSETEIITGNTQQNQCRTADFDLYGLHFHTIEQRKFSATDYSYYTYFYISIEVKDFSLNDYR